MRKSDQLPGTRPGRAARPKLTAVVRDQLLADIRAGRLRPGDRLPTEDGLMARFGVSRAPIREAMQSLQLLGMVDISPRRGTRVRALPVEAVVDLAILSGVMGQERPISDLFEFRDTMESAIAELCARNASGAQIEALRHILEENAAAVARGDRTEAQRIDVRFHAKIADASGNVVFYAVTHALNSILVELRKMTGVIPGAAEASFAEHQEIFQAIARRDGPAARRANERHIRNTRARYNAARLKHATKAAPFEVQAVKGPTAKPARVRTSRLGPNNGRAAAKRPTEGKVKGAATRRRQ